MRRVGSAGIVLLFAGVVVAAAGCFGSAPGGDARRAWQDQADAHGPMGAAATFELAGDPLFVFFSGAQTTLPGSYAWAVEPLFPRDKPFVYLEGAVVDGVGAGVLVLEGASIDVAGDGASTVPVRAVHAGDGVRVEPESPAPRPSRPDAAFPAGWDDANESFFFSEPVDVALADATVSGFDRAVLLTSDGSAHDVAAGATVSSNRVWWEAGSVFVVDAVNVEVGRFSTGGHVTDGVLKTTAGRTIEAPAAVFGRDGVVRIEAGRVASQGTVRVTQALVDEGYAFDAAVELRSSEDVVEVPVGESNWVAVSYRERSYVGDAVLEDVRTTGRGAALVEVPVERPPFLVEELWSVVEDVAEEAPWMAPFFALPVALASPAIVLVDFTRAVVCAFATCPDQYPYPSWMDAGDVGVFFFQVSGEADPGSYPVTITFEGANYDAASVDLEIVVS